MGWTEEGEWEEDKVALVVDGAGGDAVGVPAELLEGVLPVGATLLFAGSNVGKSFLAMDWGIHIAAGKPWHGHDVMVSGTVVHLYTEGRTGFANRKSAAKRNAEIEGQIPYVGVVSPIRFGGTPADKGRAQYEQELRDTAHRVNRLIADEDQTGLPPVALLIVDTVFQTNRGNENDTEAMNQYVSDVHLFLNEIIAKPSVLFVHHTGLADGDRARGSSALTAHVDATFKLSGKGTAPKVITLENTKQRDIKNLPDLPLKLEVVAVCKPDGQELRTAKGNLVTTCVIRPLEKADTAARIYSDVAAYLRAHPGASQNEVYQNVEGKSQMIRAAYRQFHGANPFDPDNYDGDDE